MSEPNPSTEITLRLCAQIAKLLAGHPSPVQGAALSDLLAMWLAGHFADTPAETAKMRERLLTAHIQMVRELIPVNEAAIKRDRR